MALPGLLLLGVIGGVACLAKNREAREKARLFAQDLADVGVSKLPPKYSDKIYEFRKGGKPSTTPSASQSEGVVFEGEYAPRPSDNNPPPTLGGI